MNNLKLLILNLAWLVYNSKYTHHLTLKRNRGEKILYTQKISQLIEVAYNDQCNVIFLLNYY